VQSLVETWHDAYCVAIRRLRLAGYNVVPLMKAVAVELAPFLTPLFNRSMAADHFPSSFKEAFITPAIKSLL